MDIKEILQNTGLREKEAAIYLAILELGESTVSKIAKKARIKRPTCYVVLQSLIEKGLAVKVMREERALFFAGRPKMLVTEAEMNLREIKRIVPQLESMTENQEGKPRVMIYEGREDIDRAYDDAFISKGENLYISTVNLAIDLFPRSYKKFLNKLPTADTKFREIVDDSEDGHDYAKKVSKTHGVRYRDIRFIPKEFLPFEADIGIFGNNVVITSLKKDYFTVRIESIEVSNAFRVVFEMMWRAANE
jgi:sugar-specific transcriptional regulator TrmB